MSIEKAKSSSSLAAVTENLVSLASEAHEISKLVLESDGELTPELEHRLDFNSTSLMAKVDSYVFIERHLEANAAIWKRKAEACKAIESRFVKSQEKLRNRVKVCMQALGEKELKGRNYRYSLSTSKDKLVIVDPKIIPNECKMVVSETVNDKEKIRSLLDAGIQVPGVVLEPVFTLKTYENAEE
jgi:hypothetical protein